VDVCHIDFETRSAADLSAVGADQYAVHPSTDIMCMGIAFNEEPVEVVGFAVAINRAESVLKRRTLMARLFAHVQSGGLVVAHNSPFELLLWEAVGVEKYSWPPLSYLQTDCTMARAYAMSLPPSLDGARAAVGLRVEKDHKGNRLMRKMCQPKSTLTCEFCVAGYVIAEGTDYVSVGCPACDGTGRKIEWHEEAEDVAALFSYCATDVEVERALDKRLLPLSKYEKRVWQLDYRINRRGVRVDVGSAKKAVNIVEMEEDRLDEAMRRATDNGVVSTRANKQLKNWITENGVVTKGVAKDDVIDLLARQDLPVVVRAAVEIRKEAAKSSTAKLEKMLTLAGADERLRGMFQYSGANTRRWAARGVQLHNLPKPKIPQSAIDKIFRSLETQSPVDARDYIELFHGAPMSMLSSCIRGFLTAAPGMRFVAMDFDSVEARVLGWLTGEEAVLEVFRTHGQIYSAQAGRTYGVHYLEIVKGDPRRDVGKVQVLSLGFQGGVNALQNMCVSLGVMLEPAFDGLWALAGQERQDRALGRYGTELLKAQNAVAKGKEPTLILLISKKEWVASELVKLAYREANPNIAKYWGYVEAAAIMAVDKPGTVVRAGGTNLPSVTFKMSGSFLLCTLPSGGRLVYPYPEVRETKTPWGASRPQLTYKYEDSQTRKFVRGSTYGGSLTENITQAVARDLLADRMLALDDEGFAIAMHVHDEAALEVPATAAEAVYVTTKKIMSVAPAWASGLPISAEGWLGFRYRK